MFWIYMHLHLPQGHFMWNTLLYQWSFVPNIKIIYQEQHMPWSEYDKKWNISM